MSILKVDTLQPATGSTVDFPDNNNITIFGLTAQSSISSTSLATITGWSKFDSQNNHAFKPIGSTVNESSGYFTPTKLGLYRIDADFNLLANVSGGVRWIEIDLKFTPNGQSEIGGDVYNSLSYSQSDANYHIANRTRFYNFNHANDKVRAVIAASATTTLKGSGASDFDTQMMFTWLAPPQAS